MASIPVIFMAFANNQEAPLKKLQEEDEGIYRLLSPGASDQRYLLHRDSFTSVNSIAQYLTDFKDRVILFHYGGHAESQQLILTDQDANAEGIAELIAQQKNLKVLFLNGCSTLPQVKKLMELNVPAVIATSSPINDTRATQFAQQFYHSLTTGNTLKDAFNAASAKLKAQDSPQSIQLYRSASFEDEIPEEQNELPWGLYVSEDKVLDWTLPEKSQREIIIRGASDKYNTQKLPVNQQLTKDLFESLSAYSDELEFLHFKAQKGDRVDERLVRRAIMDSLPAPVGEQVRKLFAADPDTLETSLDVISVARLRQLLKTYNTLIELFTFTMMAQLWDSKVQRTDLVIPDSCKKALNSYLQLNSDELPFYNYVELIREIRQVFDDHNIPYFIEELGELKEIIYEDEEFVTAHQFMEALKTELYNPAKAIAADEIESICVQSEHHLGNIFKKLGFCAKYKFATIKGIDIIKPRHRDPSFRHFKVRLDTVTAGYLDLEAVYPTFTDNKSVLLLKNLDNVDEYVSLSPFIIDENALKDEQKSKLFFFSNYVPAQDIYLYRFVNVDEDQLSISKTHFKEIYQQFEAFKKDVIGN